MSGVTRVTRVNQVGQERLNMGSLLKLKWSQSAGPFNLPLLNKGYTV